MPCSSGAGVPCAFAQQWVNTALPDSCNTNSGGVNECVSTYEIYSMPISKAPRALRDFSPPSHLLNKEAAHLKRGVERGGG